MFRMLSVSKVELDVMFVTSQTMTTMSDLTTAEAVSALNMNEPRVTPMSL